MYFKFSKILYVVLITLIILFKALVFMLYLSSLIFVEINDMHFKKLFTTDINNPYKNIEFVNSSSEINNPDGTIVFSLKNIEVPKQFSQVAVDILAQKYFRKAGVPIKLKKVEENKSDSKGGLLSGLLGKKK